MSTVFVAGFFHCFLGLGCFMMMAGLQGCFTFVKYRFILSGSKTHPMSTRFLIGIALAFAVVFIGGIASVVSVNSVTNRVAIQDDSAPKPITPSPVLSAEPVASPSDTPLATPARVPVAISGSDQGVTVADSDLASLAASVKLGQTSTGDVGKDVWAREVPVAQKLLNGMCDCDQRNWLKHFVQTGQEAIAGSNHFPDSIQVLAKLRRSNSDLSSAQVSR